MAVELDRRAFLKRAGVTGAGGALALSGPLTAYADKARGGGPVHSEGYGKLVDKGVLALPKGFNYRIISRSGETMSDGNPAPGIFDGMAAFPGHRSKEVILIRNHENRNRVNETPVMVPEEFQYDPDARANAGNTKLVIDGANRVKESYAILGGTTTNCAGGSMPWGSWITCEESFADFGMPHGYSFEIDAYAEGPVKAIPIKGAGRFVHEAVAWFAGALYETEDRGPESCFYRYLPDRTPRRPGDLARSTGRLQALRLVDHPGGVATDTGWPVGEPFAADWVDIMTPDPPADTVRLEAAALGAARFDREEGIWLGHNRIYFDCTSGGDAGLGQVWEFDPSNSTLTLIYESPGAEELKNPDNLVVVPETGHILLCEDADPPQYLRGVTTDGEIYDFAQALTDPDSEFAGACFDPSGKVLFVNQQGGRPEPDGVTYAIWGPWRSKRRRR